MSVHEDINMPFSLNANDFTSNIFYKVRLG